MSKEGKEVSEGKAMPTDSATRTNCHKCGHRYADYVKECPRCNTMTKETIRTPGPSRQFKFTTKGIFIICVTVVIVGLYTIKLVLDMGDPAISGYSDLAAGIAGIAAAITVN